MLQSLLRYCITRTSFFTKKEENIGTLLVFNFGLVSSMSNNLHFPFRLGHNIFEKNISWRLFCAEIFKQSVGARNRVGIGCTVPARQATQPGEIGILESILGLLKSLKIRALVFSAWPSDCHAVLFILSLSLDTVFVLIVYIGSELFTDNNINS